MLRPEALALYRAVGIEGQQEGALGGDYRCGFAASTVTAKLRGIGRQTIIGQHAIVHALLVGFHFEGVKNLWRKKHKISHCSTYLNIISRTITHNFDAMPGSGCYFPLAALPCGVFVWPIGRTNLPLWRGDLLLTPGANANCFKKKTEQK